MKRYLFFLAHSYSYAILLPLQEEIIRRGDQVAWWLEPSCPDKLLPSDKQLTTRKEVMDWNPLAVFAPGNYVQPWMPGVKVCVFHGYNIDKRPGSHFHLRGWFDILCTQGPSSTPGFRELEHKKGYFKVYETGWCRADEYSHLPAVEPNPRPVIHYAPTFSPSLTSVNEMLPVIEKLAVEKPWDWIISFHPLLDDAEILKSYRQLAERHANVTFMRVNEGLRTLNAADVMLGDSSSVIVQHLMLGKPAVTYRNSHPGPWLINVTAAAAVSDAIEKALTQPTELMQAIREYCSWQEAHMDGKNSARTLDAVDDFVANHLGKMKRKPLNLWRKLKLRLR